MDGSHFADSVDARELAVGEGVDGNVDGRPSGGGVDVDEAAEVEVGAPEGSRRVQEKHGADCGRMSCRRSLNICACEILVARSFA